MGGRAPERAPARQGPRGSETAAGRPATTPTEKLRQAKRPATSLAGPYGHPLHPLLVTVPIGAWVASVCFDLASRISTDAGDQEAFAKGAYWLIGLGILGALLAASIGLLDLLAIPTSTPAFRTGLLHMALNLLVVALFAVSFVVRHDRADAPDQTSVGLLALSVVALGCLGAAGWLGGRLSYRYGVRVADEATQAEGFIDPQGET